jgi:hypothetical protein
MVGQGVLVVPVLQARKGKDRLNDWFLSVTHNIFVSADNTFNIFLVYFAFFKKSKQGSGDGYEKQKNLLVWPNIASHGVS